MPNQSKSIYIIGAGPGGLSTALYLAHHGIHSTVVDKHSFPRDKICGDAFSGKVSWVMNKMYPGWIKDIASQSFQVPSWGVKFYGTENNELKVPFKLNYDSNEDIAPGFIAKRLDFDYYLYQLAQESEYITLIENCNLNQYERVGEVLMASSSDGLHEFEADVLVAADGAYSKAAKGLMQFNVEDQHNSLGIRTYYKGVKDLDSEGFIELHFLKDLLPGYFWIFPLANGEANVGAGIRTDLMRKNRIKLKQVFNDVLQNHPVIAPRFKDAELVDDVKTFGLPLGSVKRAISSDGLLLVGDAAALIDPFTGEGIGNAMISGILAAETIMEGIKKASFSKDVMSAYDKKVYKRLGAELSLSKKMQELSRYPWLFNLVVNKARRNKELQETISCMFESVDIRNKLSNPMFYFRILFS